MSRFAEVIRKTKETDIAIKLELDGSGKVDVNSGIGFFDHMLTALAVHGGFDLTLTCKGDLAVDGHHSVEDIGIVLGMAFKQALGDGKIMRYGKAEIPMDEALGWCCLDVSNRPFLVFSADFTNEKIGEYDSCLTEEFMRAFAFNAGITLHIKAVYGTNDHHKAEAMFKALAYALKQAVVLNANGQTVSTKGVL